MLVIDLIDVVLILLVLVVLVLVKGGGVLIGIRKDIPLFLIPTIPK